MYAVLFFIYVISSRECLRTNKIFKINMRSILPKKIVRADRSFLVAGCEISQLEDGETVHGDLTIFSRKLLPIS